MTRCRYLSPEGAERAVLDVRAGQSVMDAAVRANLPGIEAECGGSLICATCHVYVEEGASLPAPADEELAMLEFVAAERRPSSRLSCQLKGRDDLPELTVRLPTHQT